MLKKRLGVEAVEKDWPNDNENFKDYFKVSLTLTIPDGCEKIGKSAFVNCISLKEVVISEGVELIGRCAFQGCWKLRKVTIPGSVESIGDWAFVRCNVLREVVISEGVKWIGSHVFSSCKELKKVVIPKSVEKIGRIAFFKCEKATIILKKPISEFEVEYNAFAGCEYVKEEIGS